MARPRAADRAGAVRGWVQQIMGTAISIAAWTEAGAADRDGTAAAVERAFAELRRDDERFSPFKPESQVSRLRDGTIRPEDCDPEVREVLALCERLRRDTGGYFDAYAAGPDRLDPCGVVKGWAAERASDLLFQAGVADHYVNAGGDVRLRGQPGPDRLWGIGIADPYRPGELIATIQGSDLGIATSGIGERGAHVLDPIRGAAAVELASVTVVGPSLTLADAYATAAVAMGPAALDWLRGLHGYEAFVVAADGLTSRTPGFP